MRLPDVGTYWLEKGAGAECEGVIGLVHVVTDHVSDTSVEVNADPTSAWHIEDFYRDCVGPLVCACNRCSWRGTKPQIAVCDYGCYDLRRVVEMDCPSCGKPCGVTQDVAPVVAPS